MGSDTEVGTVSVAFERIRAVFGGLAGPTFARSLAMLVFGLALPVVIAFSAERRFDAAFELVSKAASRSYIVDAVNAPASKLISSNDYSLIALADSERANLAVMANKQVMKIIVIYMGFAVMSFAMMFIVLGFTDSPVAASGEGAGLKLDVKFGSIGAAVFVIGAAMAAGGGLLRNDYHTVGLPYFQPTVASPLGFAPPIRSFVTECGGARDPDMQLACLEGGIENYRNQNKEGGT